MVVATLLLAPAVTQCKEWTPLRWTWGGRAQLFRHQDVFGIDLGLLAAGSPKSRSAGIQFAGLYVYNTESQGISLAGLFNGASRTNGIQLGFLNSSNIRGIQAGAINAQTEPMGCNDPLSDRMEMGVKLGVVNGSACGKSMAGVSLGVFNGQYGLRGLQVGVVNIADNLSGVQIGIVNIINSRNGFGRILPFVNAAF